VIRTEEQHLAHYGILRRSGRYPWGSGSTQNQRNKSFLDITGEQRKQGMSEAKIAESHGISVIELRGAKAIAVAQQRQQNILTAERHREDGWGYSEIGRRMGHPESTIRAWLAPGAKDKADVLEVTSNMIKDHVDKKKYVDVGSGVSQQLGLTRNRFDTAIAMLREQGYVTLPVKVLQQNTGQYTTMKVLAVPGTTQKELNTNRYQIKQIIEYSDDSGHTYNHPQAPLSISSRRVGIIYPPKGAETDGIIYVRPGVKDVSIGNKRYAQVRVLVDNDRYIKGMAIYSDDLPPGRDLMFSTKQPDTGRKKDAMKELESDDPLNPFGTIIRQVHDDKGNVSSVMNIVGGKPGAGEEGAWETWKKGLASQMLSKQSPDLATQQLNITYDRRKREFDEIMSLTNPTVRKDLLVKFADATDAAAVHMQAAALPRQATKVLLPVPSMKPREIYAPTYRNGEQVALVRFPHGGTFEIPQLTVNNRNREARRLLGTSPQDAVGIHHSVAERLSGADFDGDTVLVIPNTKGTVKSTPALEGLKGFDPMKYKLDKDSPIKRMTKQKKGHEMGNVSNLITDMSLQGAGPDKLARAIKHSMVVIDAEKHGLDWQTSYKDHGIAALKEEYQGGKSRGATTLISRAGGREYIPQRRTRPAARGGKVDPATGRIIYEPTGYQRMGTKLVTDPRTGKKTRVETGVMGEVKERHKRLAVAENAYDVLRPGYTPTRMEVIYAEHSNRLKAMANDARKEALPIKGTKISPSAKKVYAKEVQSLNAKINLAERNAPRERQAQLLANQQVGLKRQANPGMEASVVKKERALAQATMRARTGAKKYRIDITQREWDAIQAGALTTHKLEKILNNTDMEVIKKYSLPKQAFKMTTAKQARAQRMLADGYTQAEVADALGVGLTTLKVALNE
jgi:hypothetical protein